MRTGGSEASTVNRACSLPTMSNWTSENSQIRLDYGWNFFFVHRASVSCPACGKLQDSVGTKVIKSSHEVIFLVPRCRRAYCQYYLKLVTMV